MANTILMRGKRASNGKRRVEKTVQQAFDEFIDFKRAENRSDRTIQSYKYNFSRFQKFLDEKAKISIISDIDEVVFTKFKLYLKDDLKIKNQTSINTIIRENKVFLIYCMEKNLLEAFKITIPKEVQKIKETYTQQEEEVLMVKPDISQCRFPEYRNWVIHMYIMATGQRAGTIRNIQIRDIDLYEGEVILRETKNKKQRSKPLPPEMVEILAEYLSIRGGEDEDYLFPTETNHQLSTYGLYTAMRRFNLVRGVSKTGTHVDRHHFCKKWIQNGGDVFTLQDLADHADIATTNIYAKQFGQDRKNIALTYNPLSVSLKNKSNKKKFKYVGGAAAAAK